MVAALTGNRFEITWKSACMYDTNKISTATRTLCSNLWALWPNLPHENRSRESKIATTKPEIGPTYSTLMSHSYRTIPLVLSELENIICIVIGISLLSCVKAENKPTCLKFEAAILYFLLPVSSRMVVQHCHYIS